MVSILDPLKAVLVTVEPAEVESEFRFPSMTVKISRLRCVPNSSKVGTQSWSSLSIDFVL